MELKSWNSTAFLDPKEIRQSSWGVVDERMSRNTQNLNLHVSSLARGKGDGQTQAALLEVRAAKDAEVLHDTVWQALSRQRTMSSESF